MAGVRAVHGFGNLAEPGEVMQRAAERGLLPVHHRDDIEIVIEHHVAQPRIAPDHAIGLVGGARGVQPRQALDEYVDIAGRSAAILQPFDEAAILVPLLRQPAAGVLRPGKERGGFHRHGLDRGQLSHAAFPHPAALGGTCLFHPAFTGIGWHAHRYAACYLAHDEERPAQHAGVFLQPERFCDPHRAVLVHQLHHPELFLEQIVGKDGEVPRLDPQHRAEHAARPAHVEQDRLVRLSGAARIGEVGDLHPLRLQLFAKPVGEDAGQFAQIALFGGDDHVGHDAGTPRCHSRLRTGFRISISNGKSSQAMNPPIRRHAALSAAAASAICAPLRGPVKPISAMTNSTLPSAPNTGAITALRA